MWSRASHTIRRIKQSWAEMDYAQRRLFEVRTGIPVTPEATRAQARAESHKPRCCSPASTPPSNWRR